LKHRIGSASFTSLRSWLTGEPGKKRPALN
jgi:hypothetical protein